ncbi:zinc finger CCHC domain-containing protein 8 isoform X1 [Cajanus cajan]|uniref:zinc finger CCHC domain-containing protein 8 isoform X1 n=1 Tax=Cajanus cajan TaxID=3821 RepID=UPI00098DA73E|nr:zinc finger CCHC domain-containing protein 8 isoform X1 [Cajanus cajan]XP_020222370.1 zinc finger CCHC domain-containing protein 8 isoform X1 [Cajanus cajan]
MAGDEPMGEIPSESSRDPNLGSESLDEEKKLEDEKCLEECLKLSVVTEEVSGRVLAENGFLSLEEGSPKRSIEIDERSVSGAKRARITVDENQPSVHFTYNSLSRASRHKLQELLQQWSEWHAKHVSSSNDASKVLESGEETFFPAVHVGLEKTSAVSFWMENQTRNDKNKDFIPLADNSVPLYDRGYALGLTSADGSSNLDGGLEIIDDAARCFNCGSYNHSLRECTRPRDNVAVNNARKKHMSRRNQNSSSRNPTRYYQNSPAGKYDGLRPGALDNVTRQLLGLGELDPPPWLNRMREIGYPPGYLDVDDEDQPSGITIYTDKEIADQEDGEIMEADSSKPKRKMTVKFPGINAPIPENANERLWGTRAGPSSSDISRNLSSSQHRSNYNNDYDSRGYPREPRLADLRDDDPPGDPGHSSSRFSFHPRFGSHDFVPPRSPTLARSPYGRSPVHDEESPRPFSFHSLHYSSPSERLFSPSDQDYGRLGNWTSDSPYDRDRDFSSRFRDWSEDRYYRSWR